MPLLGNVQDLAFKVEGTPGTAEALTASEGTTNVYDIECDPEVDFTPRPANGNLGNLPGVTGMRVGRIRFRSDCLGGATDPVWATALLLGCGYTTTGTTYRPKSEAPGSNVKNLSFGWYQNGRFVSLFGSAGNFDIVMESGKPIFINWEFTGLWGGLTSTAIIAPTKVTTKPITFRSATFTIGGVTPFVSRVQIQSNNSIEVRPSGTTATGGVTAIIGARAPKVICDPEAVLPATHDYWANFLANTEEALNLVVGTSGNRLTITAPKLQLVTARNGRRQNVFADSFEFQANKSSGDDEVTLAMD